MFFENRISGNINTLLCSSWEGKAVPYSTPWQFVTTGYEINTFMLIRWSVIHNSSDFCCMGMIFWQDQMPWPEQSYNDTSAESQTSQGRRRWDAYVCSQAQFILLPSVGGVVSNTANLSQNSMPQDSGMRLWLFISGKELTFDERL